jgi:hypothetical protein
VSGTSRISREAYVRFCEGLEVQFLGPTRQCPGRTRQRFTDHDIQCEREDPHGLTPRRIAQRLKSLLVHTLKLGGPWLQ